MSAQAITRNKITFKNRLSILHLPSGEKVRPIKHDRMIKSPRAFIFLDYVWDFNNFHIHLSYSYRAKKREGNIKITL